MDQRVDNERRLETAPGREAKPAVGQARPDGPWLERLRARRRMVLILTALVIVAVAATVFWWVNSVAYESTDDAFIDARTVPVSAQISAAIVDVPVTDNQLVEAGAVLLRLDDRDYRAQADQAKAQMSQAQASITSVEAQVAAQQARIEQAEKQTAQAQAALTFAKQEDDRYQRLVKTGAVTVEQAQQYTSNFLQVQASFAAAERNESATRMQLPVLQAQRTQAEAQVEQARAALEQAETNLSRTTITAPVAGRIARLTAAKGVYAAVGQALIMFVPREVWVTANFKETQLRSVRPGDSVTIKIDAFPHHKFKGHVDSIQAGSGTAFSLLPAENATGNYVKIVQRVPVKIVFDEQPDILLGPGMSVVPTVRVR
ncbi:MAG TPA: HlyD family secretion protein [Xanthobacteraceae bacterium]|nr:HlyD family secretion protein [Xanthobacteraceae bacterium]